MTILESFEKYQHILRFHTPGHKGRAAHAPYDVVRMDLTELAQTDCLYRPEGVIFQAQKRIADAYNVAESRMLVNGSSGGLLAAILASFSPKDKVLLPRGSHISVYHGLLLQDIDPVYVYPDASLPAEACTISLENILAADQKHALAGLIVTYPTYLGTCTDINKIAAWAQENGKILLVDEAHGAHLAFCEDYPVAAERTGADIVVQSTHKTLSSLTQSAVLLAVSRNVDLAKLDLYLRLFQSSSPSYLLLSSLEEAVEYAKKNAKNIFADIAAARGEFAAMFEQDKYDLWQPQGAYDFAKLVIGLRDENLHGREIQRKLSQKKIELEYAAKDFVLAYCGIGTTKDDIMSLAKALNEITSNKKGSGKREKYLCTPAKAHMSMREALAQKAKYVPVKEAVRRVAADFVVPYPPGVPLLVPGEVIGEETVQIILRCIQNKETVAGVEKNEIRVTE